jgi:hypothetical protein
MTRASNPDEVTEKQCGWQGNRRNTDWSAFSMIASSGAPTRTPQNSCACRVPCETRPPSTSAEWSSMPHRRSLPHHAVPSRQSLVDSPSPDNDPGQDRGWMGKAAAKALSPRGTPWRASIDRCRIGGHALSPGVNPTYRLINREDPTPSEKVVSVSKIVWNRINHAGRLKFDKFEVLHNLPTHQNNGKIIEKTVCTYQPKQYTQNKIYPSKKDQKFLQGNPLIDFVKWSRCQDIGWEQMSHRAARQRAFWR